MSWGSSGSGNRTESRTCTKGQTKNLTYQRTDHYLRAPGSASGSGSGSGSGTGSASGSAARPRRLTQIEKSGSGAATRQLDYDYSGSGTSQAHWGNATAVGSSGGSWHAVRSIHQESHSTESLNRTITFSASGQATSSGSNVRWASATGSADAFYQGQWEDHWWLGQETWASGGSYHNGTYDDNYQYQWTKTWLPDGQPVVSESATNHVSGIEKEHQQLVEQLN